jgi:hypothetical protein
MAGKYIGTFGQKRPWNLKHILDDSRPPDRQNRLPPDIKRVASYETLNYFNHGNNSWKLAKNIINILTIKNRIQKLKMGFSKKPTPPPEPPKQEKVENTQENSSDGE